MTQDMNECLTVSVPEAGRILGISRNSAYQAARAGEIPALRIGHKLRVPKAALLEMINGQPAA